METDWITINVLAARLGVRVAHLRALVSRHEIPFSKVGRLVRFHWPTIEAWLTGSHAAPSGSGTSL